MKTQTEAMRYHIYLAEEQKGEKKEPCAYTLPPPQPQSDNCKCWWLYEDMEHLGFFKKFLFIYGCVGSLFLCEGFLQLRQVGATLHHGVRASHYRGLSCCGAQAPDAQAQQLWLTGLVAPRHVGSSQTRARTRVPCIGRQIPNHCTTREAPTPGIFIHSWGEYKIKEPFWKAVWQFLIKINK